MLKDLLMKKDVLNTVSFSLGPIENEGRGSDPANRVPAEFSTKRKIWDIGRVTVMKNFREFCRR